MSDVKESTEYESLIGVKEAPSLFPTLGEFIGEEDTTGQDIDTKEWMSHWKRAPEYEAEKCDDFKAIIMHFNTEEDYDLFKEKLDMLHLTPKTKSAYFPSRFPRDLTVLRWMDPEEVE